MTMTPTSPMTIRPKPLVMIVDEMSVTFLFPFGVSGLRRASAIALIANVVYITALAMYPIRCAHPSASVLPGSRAETTRHAA